MMRLALNVLDLPLSHSSRILQATKFPADYEGQLAVAALLM